MPPSGRLSGMELQSKSDRSLSAGQQFVVVSANSLSEGYNQLLKVCFCVSICVFICTHNTNRRCATSVCLCVYMGISVLACQYFSSRHSIQI